MIIENSFEVPVAPEHALDVLTDVPAIAPCIPGVTLTETLGEGAYKGVAAVRLGPVSLSFGGEARITAVDREAGTAKVEAEGADQKGRGRASAKVSFSISPSGSGSKVDVHSDVTLSGQVAQYGRASGLINEVANQIISDFAANLETKLAEQGGAAEEQGQAVPASETVQAGETVATATPPKAAPVRNEISGFGLIWRVIRAYIARLFQGSGSR